MALCLTFWSTLLSYAPLTTPATPNNDFASAPLIWVVEDSAEDFAVLARAMRGAGPATLVQWPRAEEAVERLDATPEVPALLLVDLNLPGMDGAAFIERVRASGDQRWSEVPICVLSSSTRTTDIERTKAAGANAYRVKPRRAAELRELAQYARSLAARLD